MAVAATYSGMTCDNAGWVDYTGKTVKASLIAVSILNAIITVILCSFNMCNFAGGYIYGYDYLTSLFNFVGYIGAVIYYALLDSDATAAQGWCDLFGSLYIATNWVYPYVYNLENSFTHLLN